MRCARCALREARRQVEGERGKSGPIGQAQHQKPGQRGQGDSGHRLRQHGPVEGHDQEADHQRRHAGGQGTFCARAQECRQQHTHRHGHREARSLERGGGRSQAEGEPFDGKYGKQGPQAAVGSLQSRPIVESGHGTGLFLPGFVQALLRVAV